MVSSRIAPDPYIVHLSDTDMADGALSRLCYVRPTYMFTADHSVITKRVGALTPGKLRDVIAEIMRALSHAS